MKKWDIVSIQGNSDIFVISNIGEQYCDLVKITLEGINETNSIKTLTTEIFSTEINLSELIEKVHHSPTNYCELYIQSYGILTNENIRTIENFARHYTNKVLHIRKPEIHGMSDYRPVDKYDYWNSPYERQYRMYQDYVHDKQIAEMEIAHLKQKALSSEDVFFLEDQFKVTVDKEVKNLNF